VSTTEVDNALAERRRALGLSQAELAASVGVSRQALSALEGGRSVPSTAVALRLARALDCTVESLFWLAEGPAVPVRVAGEPSSGRAIVGRVEGRWVAHPLGPDALHAAADAELRPDGRRTVARLLDDPERLGRRLLVAGCDPALGLLAATAARAGVELSWLPATSAAALALVARGEAHVAGAHLYDAETDEHNVPFVRATLPGRACALLELASTEEGLVVAPGARSGVGGVEDLVRGDVVIVNRPEGAGARGLLDRELARAGIAPASVRGYERELPGHEAVARAVASGSADAGVATRAVALAHGLGFVPLHGERFDLVVPAGLLDYEPARRLVSVLNGAGFRRQLAAVAGYDTAGTGREVART
jgi:molybdate-binding protein/DNA-binding XRE family transcriptional regulator